MSFSGFRSGKSLREGKYSVLTCSDCVVHWSTVGHKTTCLTTDSVNADIIEPSRIKSFQDAMGGIMPRNINCVRRKPRHFKIIIVSSCWNIPCYL